MVEDKNGWHTGEMTNSFIENHFYVEDRDAIVNFLMPRHL